MRGKNPNYTEKWHQIAISWRKMNTILTQKALFGTLFGTYRSQMVHFDTFLGHIPVYLRGLLEDDPKNEDFDLK